MAFTAKTRSDIKQTIVNLLNTAGISPLGSGISENIIDGAVDIIFESEQKKEDIDTDTNPTLANGTKLEAFAGSLGISRELASSVADLTYTNFNFYIGGGAKARDITVDSAGFIIPAGVEITDTFDNVYVTLNDAVFRDDSDVVYVPIAAVSPVAADVPPNSLVEYSFDLLLLNNVTEDSLGEIQIFSTNNRAIKGGAVDESDENLRYKIGLFGNSLNQSNEQRLTGVLTGIPGVTSVSLQKNRRGIGSVEVAIETDVNTPSDAIYAQAEALIKAYIYGADNIYVLKPVYIPVAMTITPIFSEGTIENLTEVRNSIAIAVSDYVNTEIPRGGVLIADSIIEVVLETVPNMENASLGCLYINNRRVVPGTQKLRSDQKFIVLNPIDIKVG